MCFSGYINESEMRLGNLLKVSCPLVCFSLRIYLTGLCNFLGPLPVESAAAFKLS